MSKNYNKNHNNDGRRAQTTTRSYDPNNDDFLYGKNENVDYSQEGSLTSPEEVAEYLLKSNNVSMPLTSMTFTMYASQLFRTVVDDIASKGITEIEKIDLWVDYDSRGMIRRYVAPIYFKVDNNDGNNSHIWITGSKSAPRSGAVQLSDGSADLKGLIGNCSISRYGTSPEFDATIGSIAILTRAKDGSNHMVIKADPNNANFAYVECDLLMMLQSITGTRHSRCMSFELTRLDKTNNGHDYIMDIKKTFDPNKRNSGRRSRNIDFGASTRAIAGASNTAGGRR